MIETSAGTWFTMKQKLLGLGFHSVLRVLRRPLTLSTSRCAPGIEASVTEETPKPFSKVPGLKGLPVLGCVPMLIRELRKAKARDENIFHLLHSKFGPIYRLRMLGNTWQVLISNPEAAEKVFRVEGKYPSRGLFENNFMWIFKKLKSPPPMFLSNGEVWKKTRSSAAKQVIPRRVGNFVGPLSIIADELLSHLEGIQEEHGTVPDISEELAKWAFQGVSYFVYGEKIDIYLGTDPLLKEFMEAGMGYIRGISVIGSALPLYRIYPTKRFRQYEKIVRRMQRAGKQMLDRRYEEIKDAMLSGTVDETKAVGLLDQWMIEGKFTEEEALSNSYDMLSAGIDTTSNSANFLLYEIAKQPELQERLVQEILSVVGDKEHPSWEDLQEMTLVRNCVKETMRMYVPTGVVPRVIAEDAVLLGYRIPAGTEVIISLNTMGMNEEIFKNPRQFNPDRWSKETATQSHPFSHLPFGFGPRSCYGRRLAELELYILLSKMLPRYSLSTTLKTEDLKQEKKVVLRAAVPVPITFNPRNN